MAGFSPKLGVLAALLIIVLGLAIWMFSEKSSEAISVSILESAGRCGAGSSELSLVRYDGEYVEVVFKEPANTPCYSHVIKGVKISRDLHPRIEISLELKKTSEVCIECLGIVETRLKIGPIERGSEIVVNGLAIRI